MSGGRPTDGDIPPAKKRGNARQLTKDDESEEEETIDPGNFEKASEDVLKKRKIVRARRAGGGAPAAAAGAGAANPFSGVSLVSTAAASNPFAAVTLLPTAAPVETKKPEQAASTPAEDRPQEKVTAAAEVTTNKEVPDVKDAPAEQSSDKAAKEKEEKSDTKASEAPAGSAEANPAAEKTSTENGATPASSSAPAAGQSIFSTFASASASPFAVTAGNATTSFGFGKASGTANGGATTAFGTLPATPLWPVPESKGFSFASGGSSGLGFTFPATSTIGTFGTGPATVAAPSVPEGGLAARPAVTLAEEPTVTGEEDEQAVFTGEGTLFEFDDSKQWRERGRGELKVNMGPSGQARLIMRQKGNLRLLLNANLWPDMVVTVMEGGKGATFACINHARGVEGEEEKESGPPKLSTFAFRMKLADKVQELVATMNKNKVKGQA